MGKAWTAMTPRLIYICGPYPSTSILAKPPTMARKRNTVAVPHKSTHGEAAIREFANSNLTPEQLRQRTPVLLDSKELLRNVLGLTPVDQTKVVDKIDQVRHRDSCFFLGIFPPSIPAKVYPSIDSQNGGFVTALGNVCSATERLPASTVLSAGLEKRGNIAVASGGLTDIWQGDYHGTQVAIKVFRIYSAQKLKEAKEVSAR